MTIACTDCGTLQDIPSLPSGAIAICPTCDNRLERTNGRSITITDQVRSLTSSPQLHDSLAHPDATLAALERISRQAGAQVAPTLREVRTTVASLRAAAQQMDATRLAAQSGRMPTLIAVGTPITGRPPHKAERARLRHSAST